MLGFIQRQPARVFAVVVAVLTLLAAYNIDLPQEAWLGVVGAVLALVAGEGVQRVEDGKTEAALWTDPLEVEYGAYGDAG